MNAPLYLLDTNILVHGVCGGAKWEEIKTQYNPLLQETRPIVSVVSVGELQSLAYQWGWRDDKTEQLRWLLTQFDQLDINSAPMINAYALIDTVSRRVGVRMGKNDVWIAATAYVANATLLTTDADFSHLPPGLVNVALV